MKVLQPGEKIWLVLDEALKIQFQIELGFATRSDLHETHEMYRVGWTGGR